ncbi:LLM class flavin-dependent oxidoreductase [Pseudogemmobacter faecipullorum]|uniref:LLM class flavin-dependent oxidoreductase n=1 Tax=Pseudogemmobacter faecipullorum TaxID=2755041 RepID=A0ABS8CQ56_9RHOB|nr:LLM class flavin-dependent oxidoreductase [Pseudogemmobacter faecipullorum]MCB5411531.1 LLM class flavin-dependent oxidoreductase [Pseudogemmobacter faecipullorum]
MQTPVPLSLLDLVRVREGAGPREALAEAQSIAAHVDRLGFNRYWVAEHHNMQGIASAATSVVLAHAGQHTQRIRIGSGGIMLPNHSPYIIAEQFGTLAALYPGRVDLGLGRAPGTDQATLRAIRTPQGAAERFPEDIAELQHWFAPDDQPGYIRAWPAAGAEVDLWVLGSSQYGAMLAAEYGLPYGFASHFAPDYLDEAMHLYRSRFKPSEQLAAPYAMVGVNVICAETEAEATRLFTTAQMSFTGIFRNARGLSQPPIDDIETYWTASEKAQVSRMLGCAVIGTPERVKAGLEALQRRTGADELIIVSDIFDAEARRRSLALTAGVWGLKPEA